MIRGENCLSPRVSFGGSSSPSLDVEKNGGAAAFIFAIANF
jgi:hypothetical protein